MINYWTNRSEYIMKILVIWYGEFKLGSGSMHPLGILAVAAFATFSSLGLTEARAAVVFQTGAPSGYDTRDAESNFTTVLSVSEAVTITNIGQETSLTSDGLIKFFIYDASSGAQLYLSEAEPFFADGRSYKISDPFSFTFMPGTSYSVGAVADVSAQYGYVFGPAASMNGITSALSNQNVSGFADLTLDNNHYCCDSRLELLREIAVPEPMSLSLLGASLIGFVAARRRQI